MKSSVNLDNISLVPNKRLGRDKQTEEEGHLLQVLEGSQLEDLRFPLNCQVVYTHFKDTDKDDGSSLPQVIHGSVAGAYVDSKTSKIVYRVVQQHEQNKENSATRSRSSNNNNKHSACLAPEEDLQFVRGTPVWAIPVGGEEKTMNFAAATVLHACSNPASYSVQMESNKVVHHFVTTENVRYRKDSMAPPPLLRDTTPSDKSSSAGQRSYNAYASMDTGGTTTESRNNKNNKDSPEDSKHQLSSSSSSLGRRKRSSKEEDEDSVTTTATAASGESATTASPTTTGHDSSTTAKRRKKSSAAAAAHHFCSLVLPKMACVSTMKANLLNETNRAKLERKTRCNLTLHGRAIEVYSSRPFRMYIDITGETKRDVDFAFAEIEKLLLLPLRDYPSRLFMMYDVAYCNRQYYICKQGGFMYQREPPCFTTAAAATRRKSSSDDDCWVWMFAVSLPSFWGDQGVRMLIGKNDTGSREILAGTKCTIHVCKKGWDQLALIVHGATFEEVRVSALRAQDRIAWVNGILPSKMGPNKV